MAVLRKKKKVEGLDPVSVRGEVEALGPGIVDFLDRLVSINSHSPNFSGVDRVADLVAEHLPRAMAPLDEPGCNADNRIWAFGCGKTAAPPFLMVGHLDTVFPPGEFDKGLSVEQDHFHGPGVADMKGGVAVMVGAALALERLGLLDSIRLTLAFNGDEEIGSVCSCPLLRQLAQNSRAGLVFECGGAGGSLVTSRRGLRRYRLEVRGQGGHAGFVGRDKQSAIVELAHQILRIEAFNKPKTGITVNVGRISGGTATNVVPELAEAEFELRYWEDCVGDSAAERIMASLAAPSGQGFEHILERTHVRAAMPRRPENSRLFKTAARISRELGHVIKEEARPGASDANIIAAAGLPTLDGLGPVGEWDHSRRERIEKKSLLDRIELTVHLLHYLNNAD